MANCPLCTRPAQQFDWMAKESGYQISCRTCGSYDVASAVLAAKLLDTPDVAARRHLLSALTKVSNEPIFVDKQRLATLCAGVPSEKTIQQKIELMVRWFADRSSEIGARIKTASDDDYPAAWCKSPAEWTTIFWDVVNELKYLEHQGDTACVTVRGHRWLAERSLPGESSASPVSDPDRAPDEEFMRSAIAEARKCVSDPGRIDPMVGVVIARDGKKLAAAHRARDAGGEHAEFTALRELENASVAGATVYATLEPCTTRNPPKRPCAKRLVERKVKRVFIGMLDPDVRIKGRGVEELRDAGIDVQFFVPELMSQVEELNREFIRDRRSRSGLGSRVGEVERVGVADVATRALADIVPGKPRLRLTIKYPEVVAGLPEPAVEEINGALRGVALDFLHGHRKYVSSRAGDPDVTDDSEDEIDQGFRVTLAQPDLFSVQFFEVWEIFLCRPVVGTTTRTYHLPNVTRVHLADLGWKDRTWRSWLSDFCRRALKAKNALDEWGNTDDEMIENGTQPEKVHEWPFCLTTEGLVISFDTETTGPVAWGAHDVLIPYAELAPVVNADGLLGGTLRAP
jgi:pyrimidine deaminase RibD-like protein